MHSYDPRLGSDASHADASCVSRSPDTDLDADRTMKLREERLTVDKRPVQAGEIRLGKEAITQQQSIDVPLAHEEAILSRRPVREGEFADAAGEISDIADISVPVMREEVAFEKRAVVTEEVGRTKQTVQETRPVSETVRKERATVETDGDIAGQVKDNVRP